ncbi:MAG: hypothetical protein V1817_03480 [Candidatus Micrarchaeota archaeon]
MVVMGVVSRIMNAANEFGSVKSKIVEHKSTIGGMPIGGRNYVRFSVDPAVIKKITCWARWLYKPSKLVNCEDVRFFYYRVEDGTHKLIIRKVRNKPEIYVYLKPLTH